MKDGDKIVEQYRQMLQDAVDRTNGCYYTFLCAPYILTDASDYVYLHKN